MSQQQPVALIVGAANNIGAETARIFSRDHFVVLCDIMDPEPVAREIGEGKAVAVQGDITNYDDCVRMVAETAKHGYLRSLVCTVGISSAGDRCEAMPLDEWHRVLDVNLTGPFQLCRASIPLMREAAVQEGDRAIVLISSRSGKAGTVSLTGYPNGMQKVHYCASKAGVDGLVKSLANELAPEQIRVNSVAPGPIQTLNATGRAGATIPTSKWEALSKLVPLGRMGKPADIGEACHFLCSSRASFITGHVLDVNGGVLMD